jgi:hypothetical protein
MNELELKVNLNSSIDFCNFLFFHILSLETIGRGKKEREESVCIVKKRKVLEYRHTARVCCPLFRHSILSSIAQFNSDRFCCIAEYSFSQSWSSLSRLSKAAISKSGFSLLILSALSSLLYLFFIQFISFISTYFQFYLVSISIVFYFPTQFPIIYPAQFLSYIYMSCKLQSTNFEFCCSPCYFFFIRNR